MFPLTCWAFNFYRSFHWLYFFGEYAFRAFKRLVASSVPVLGLAFAITVSPDPNVASPSRGTVANIPFMEVAREQFLPEAVHSSNKMLVTDPLLVPCICGAAPSGLPAHSIVTLSTAIFSSATLLAVVARAAEPDSSAPLTIHDAAEAEARSGCAEHERYDACRHHDPRQGHAVVSFHGKGVGEQNAACALSCQPHAFAPT